MSREIKFRGKRLDTGEWVYGYYWAYQGRHFIKLVGVDHEVDPKTVDQSTSLTDKNGREIYEGDIVSRGIGNPWVIGGGLSFYQDVADMERFLRRGDAYEVIGNIYENSELLT